jgi:predicted TIM-barrel fold metal-dependent hydrolase
VVNLGGGFPMLVERMDHVVATRDPGAPRPSALLGRIMFDTASLGPRALELAVNVLGAERIMLGTDFPIFATDVTTQALATAAIPEAARIAIASGNALRVLERGRCGST